MVAHMHPDCQEVLFKESAIHARCNDIGKQIAADFADKQPLFLVTLSGAFMFAAELLKRIEPVPAGLQVDFIRASSYGAGTTSSGTVDVQAAAGKIACRGRHVIIVEDIVDSGGTLKRLRSHVKEAGAASTSVVSMLDKPARRTTDVKLEYVGFECPDEFVVGFGLDVAEEYRSLPHIAVLRPEVITRYTQ